VAEKLKKLEKQIAEQDLFNRRIASENGELKKKLSEYSQLPPAEKKELDEIESKHYLDLIDDDKKFDTRLERKMERMLEAREKARLQRESQELVNRQKAIEQTKTLVDQAMPDLAMNLDGMAQAAIEAGATIEQANFLKSNVYAAAANMPPETFRMLYVAGKAYQKIGSPATVVKRAGDGKVNLGSLGKSAGKNGSTREMVPLTVNRLANMSHSDKKAALAKAIRDENII
jgi:hypothetical protein